MNITRTTIKALIALLHEAIDAFGERAILIILGASLPIATPTTPTIPVNLPTPLPSDFNEAFYLAANPDVVPYVGVGKAYATGGDHYLLWGRMEGRKYKPDTWTTTILTPIPPVEQWNPKAAYSSSMAMLADITGNNFPQAVNLDGRNVKEGFGPAVNYYQWADGTVRTEDSGQGSLPLVVDVGSQTKPPKVVVTSPVDGEILDVG